MLENRLHKHKECQGTKYQNQTLHLKKKLTEAVENDFVVSCLAPKTHPGLEFF